jgi:NADH dehydrogenase FAD-containing subunit
VPANERPRTILPRGAKKYATDRVARDIDVELLQDGVKSLDAPAAIIHTEQGAELEYDALLLAPGARSQPASSMRLRSTIATSTNSSTG